MSAERSYSIDEPGYFGITLLDLGEDARELMNHSVNDLRERKPRRYFDEATALDHPSMSSLTIEGLATSTSAPSIAIDSLMTFAAVAKKIDAIRNHKPPR